MLPYISSSAGVLTVLSAVAATFFFLEQKTRWKLFTYLPPLVFIYATPAILSNVNMIPKKSDVYTWMSSMVLPMVLILLLLNVNLRAALKVMGRAVGVTLIGTLGVIVGAPIAYSLVHTKLGEEGWKAFGTLSGSWIGGTGNMAAVAEMIQAQGSEFGLAVLADNVLCLVWIPLMLVARQWAAPFARFTGADPKKLERLLAESKGIETKKPPLKMQHILYLITLGLFTTWISTLFSERLPDWSPILGPSTWRILLVTTFGLALSFTRASQITGAYEFSMALLYLFVANMGAKADLSGLAAQAPWFLLASSIWIVIHGIFCVLGAKLLRTDIHTAVIASAVNIGGVASAPVVAAHHHPGLVPASILLALLCYAIANYAGWLTALLCRAMV